MQNTGKKWILKDQYPPEFAERFPNEDDLTLQLLYERGIKAEKEKEKFFNPDYESDTHDPFLLKDMKRAVDRIIRAMKNSERVVVFGDYDADGMSGASIFHDFFRQTGFDNFEVYIPDRYKEGYGLSREAIAEFTEEHPSLVITVDCGITNTKEVDFLNSKGADVIIVDHHIPPDDPPKAYAIIDAKREDDEYPYDFLCGAGTAFKAVQAILKTETFGLVPGWEKWLLDLVCIATVADMVPLTGENRTLVYYGLQVMRKTRRLGLLALYQKLRVEKSRLTEEDIAFSIAPYVNAASRMGHQTTSFDLLTTNSREEAEWIMDKIFNTRAEQRRLVEDVVTGVKQKYPDPDMAPEVIVAGDKSWNPGVLGISANRLLEFYSRPVFLWGMGDESGNIKGSARSGDGVSVVEVMRNMPEGFLIDAGGHHKAGGFSVGVENDARLEEEIKMAYAKTDKLGTETQEVFADRELTLADVNREFYANVQKFSPFGIDNPSPIFWFKGLEVRHVASMGNGGAHFKMTFHLPSGEDINAILWFKGESREFPEVFVGDRIDLLASIKLSRFNGSEELRLEVADYKIVK